MQDQRRGSPPSTQGGAQWVELSGRSSAYLHVFLVFPPPVCFARGPMSGSVSSLCLLAERVFPQTSMAWWRSRTLSFLPEWLCALSSSAVSDYCSFGDLHTYWTLKGQFEEREVRLFAAELGCALGSYIQSTPSTHNSTRPPENNIWSCSCSVLNSYSNSTVVEV